MCIINSRFSSSATAASSIQVGERTCSDRSNPNITSNHRRERRRRKTRAKFAFFDHRVEGWACMKTRNKKKTLINSDRGIICEVQSWGLPRWISSLELLLVWINAGKKKRQGKMQNIAKVKHKKPIIMCCVIPPCLLVRAKWVGGWGNYKLNSARAWSSCVVVWQCRPSRPRSTAGMRPRRRGLLWFRLFREWWTALDYLIDWIDWMSCLGWFGFSKCFEI